jgi:nitroreductase
MPQHIPEAASLCIDCYHCVAACPHGALAIDAVKASSCQPLTDKATLSQKQAEQFLRARRSIRIYKKEEVNKEEIAALIRIACHAPAGHNHRELHWLVVHSPADVQRLAGMVVDWTRDMLAKEPSMAKMFHFERIIQAWEAGLDPVCRKAPHLLIVHASKHSPMAQSAATIALTYLELAAYAAGMGTCWAGYFNIAANAWEPLRNALPIRKGDTVCGAMMLGYPQYKYHRLPPRPEATINYF